MKPLRYALPRHSFDDVESPARLIAELPDTDPKTRAVMIRSILSLAQRRRQAAHEEAGLPKAPTRARRTQK